MAAKLVAVACRELREQVALAVEQVRHGVVHGSLAGGREPHDDAAAVGGSGLATDQPATFQPVDPVGHRAARHEGLADQLAGESS